MRFAKTETMMIKSSISVAAANIPIVTVIVPAYNSEATLGACLESVFANPDPAYEVIVVNDASTDRTAEIAMQYPCRLINLRANIMAANCRNLGAVHAHGEFLVFFDADQIMRPDTLQSYVRAFQVDPQTDAVVGSFAIETPAPGFFSKFKNLRHHYVHQTADPEGTTLASGLTAIRKQVFLGAGGFEPAYAGASIEDIALGYTLRRLGHHIRFRADIQVWHLKGYTLRELLVSDVFDRAVPWTALLLRERVWHHNLNTSRSNVLSVILSWMIPAAFAAEPWPLGVLLASAAITIIAASNAGLLRVALRHFGRAFTAKAVLFLPLMYFCHGCGLSLGAVSYALGRSATRKRKAPEPDGEIIDCSLSAVREPIASDACRLRVH
jgi:glycosyltransferase involved in cell wall biosynthesis